MSKERVKLWALLGVVGLVHVLGWTIQIKSGENPWAPAAPIDSFTAGFLWMSVAVCLFIAFERIGDRLRFVFWMLGSLGFMSLAIDEMMEFHELTRHAVGDDDYIKTLAWVLTAAALWAISKLEPEFKNAHKVLWLGYGFHCLYTLVEMGDGDYFTLPVSIQLLKWVEEISEMCGLSCYLIGMTLIFQGILALREKANS